MPNEPKLIKNSEGAVGFNAKGENQFILNWKDNIIEVYNNGNKLFIIDMNES